MSTITQLINELETIANAQTGLEHFIYGEPYDVNNFRDKTYPTLLLDSRVAIEQLDLKSAQRVYTFQLHFYDVYTRTSVVATNRQTQQRGIELVAEKFLQQFRKRYRSTGYPWKIENETALTGNWQFLKHNDRLIQLTYQLKIRSQGECVTGTFNY